MKLIRVSDTTLINADRITAIKIEKIDDKPTVTIIVDGFPYTATNEMIIRDLISGGVEVTEQFFAG